MAEKTALIRQPALWSAAAPLVCAVHCVGAPIVVFFAPMLAVPEWVEPGLLLLSAVLALGFGVSGFRAHGRPLVWAPLAGGLLLWAAGLAGWIALIPEPVTTAAGGVLTAAGMIWNARLRHRASCSGCGCPAHG